MVAGLLAVIAAVLAATQLTPDASPALLNDSGSDTARLTSAVEGTFGAEPIVVEIDAPLPTLLAPGDIIPLAELEGKLADVEGVDSVIGPGTFINQTIVQIESSIK